MLFRSELNWYFREQIKGAIAAGKANSLPVRHSEAGSSRHYPKGASVLHMLRHVMGDDPFNRAINHYLLKHQYETVETWDLQKAIIDETGMNMDWFFDQWIHRGGEPIYAVNWSYVADSTSKKPVTVTLEITQKQVQDAVVGLFKMPIWIEFLYANGKSEWRQIMVDQAHHTFHFNTRMIPVTVVFDAGSQVLKTLEMQKSPSEWLWQMQHGSSMLDRYDALVALRGNTEIKDYKTENTVYKNKIGTLTMQNNTLQLANEDLQNTVLKADEKIKALRESLEKDLGQIDFIVHSIAFAPKEGLSGRFYDISKEAFDGATTVCVVPEISVVCPST